MKAGVRNKFVGEIVEIKRGTIMAEIVVKCGEYYVTSALTADSLDENEFKVGDQVTALIKAVSVTLVK